jgi:hypothetical protein
MCARGQLILSVALSGLVGPFVVSGSCAESQISWQGKKRQEEAAERGNGSRETVSKS